MDEIEREPADGHLRRVAAAEYHYTELTREARQRVDRIMGATGVVLMLAIVGMLLVSDAPAMSKISAAAIMTFALLFGGLVYALLSRRPGEWSRPAMLMGAEPVRRRRIRRALLLGRPIEQADVELVVDLRTKLRTGRWLMLLGIGLQAPVLLYMLLRSDGLGIFGWAALLSVPLLIYGIVETFWLYRRAGRALDAHGLQV